MVQPVHPGRAGERVPALGAVELPGAAGAPIPAYRAPERCGRAQIALRPGSPLTVADIDLPPELLRGGSNHLSFTAAQHYTNDCENPAAAELWSQVDTSRSRPTVSGRPVAVSPHLSDLPELIGPGFFGGHRFTLMTVRPEAAGSDGTLSNDAVQIGAAIAQALGLRLRYQAPSIDFATAQPVPGSDDLLLRLQAPTAGPADDASDLVLFGTAAELAPILGPDFTRSLAKTTGGFLGLYTLPADRNRLVLVVSGPTATDVRRAAEALGVAGFPFVDAAEQTVDALDLRPDADRDPARRRRREFGGAGLSYRHPTRPGEHSILRGAHPRRLVRARQRGSGAVAGLRLWCRPAVGLSREHPAQWSVPAGAGFAGPERCGAARLQG